MIIKISSKDSWIVYDGFDRVYYQYISYNQAIKYDVDAKWLREKRDGKKDDTKDCVCLCARKKGLLGIEYSIIADEKVYLCNDEGKTIERIN